jgi:hypothetical protein
MPFQLGMFRADECAKPHVPGKMGPGLEKPPPATGSEHGVDGDQSGPWRPTEAAT